jgi:hypothetical protein
MLVIGHFRITNNSLLSICYVGRDNFGVHLPYQIAKCNSDTRSHSLGHGSLPLPARGRGDRAKGWWRRGVNGVTSLM